MTRFARNFVFSTTCGLCFLVGFLISGILLNQLIYSGAEEEDANASVNTYIRNNFSEIPIASHRLLENRYGFTVEATLVNDTAEDWLDIKIDMEIFVNNTSIAWTECGGRHALIEAFSSAKVLVGCQMYNVPVSGTDVPDNIRYELRAERKLKK